MEHDLVRLGRLAKLTIHMRRKLTITMMVPERTAVLSVAITGEPTAGQDGVYCSTRRISATPTMFLSDLSVLMRKEWPGCDRLKEPLESD